MHEIIDAKSAMFPKKPNAVMLHLPVPTHVTRPNVPMRFILPSIVSGPMNLHRYVLPPRTSFLGFSHMACAGNDGCSIDKKPERGQHTSIFGDSKLGEMQRVSNGGPTPSFP
jgi:hypothetical protein